MTDKVKAGIVRATSSARREEAEPLPALARRSKAVRRGVPLVEEDSRATQPRPQSRIPTPAKHTAVATLGQTHTPAATERPVTVGQLAHQLLDAFARGDSRKVIDVFYGRSKETQQAVIRTYDALAKKQSIAGQVFDAGVRGLAGGLTGAVYNATREAMERRDFAGQAAQLPEAERLQLEAVLRNPSSRVEAHDRLRHAYSGWLSKLTFGTLGSPGQQVLEIYDGLSHAQVAKLESDYARVYGDNPESRARATLNANELARWTVLRRGSDQRGPIHDLALRIFEHGRGRMGSNPTAMFEALERGVGNMAELERAYRDISGSTLAADFAGETSGTLSRMTRSSAEQAHWDRRISSALKGQRAEYLAATAHLFVSGEVDWNETRRGLRALVGKQGTTFAQVDEAYRRSGGTGGLREALTGAARGDKRVAADLALIAPLPKAPPTDPRVTSIAAELEKRIGDFAHHDENDVEAFLRDVPADLRAPLEKTFQQRTGKTVGDALRARMLAELEDLQTKSAAMAGAAPLFMPQMTLGKHGEARIVAMLETLRGTRTAEDDLLDVARGLNAGERFRDALGRASLTDLTQLRGRYSALASKAGAPSFDQAVAKLPSDIRQAVQLRLQMGEMLQTGNFNRASGLVSELWRGQRALDGSAWTAFTAQFADITGFRGLELDDAARGFMFDAHALRAKAERGEPLTDVDRARMRVTYQRFAHNLSAYMQEKGENAQTAGMIAATVATLGYGAIAGAASLTARGIMMGALISGTTDAAVTTALNDNITPAQVAQAFLTGTAFEAAGAAGGAVLSRVVRARRAAKAAAAPVEDATRPVTETAARVERAEPSVRAVESPVPAQTVARPAALPERAFRDMQIGERLNHGASSNVYEIPGRPDRVAIIHSSLDPRVSGRAAMTDAASAEVEAGLRASIEHTAAARGLTFEGHPVAPIIESYIRDDAGRVIGYVTERVAGRELADLTRLGQLTPDQLTEVTRQLQGQLDVLHRAGLTHGDAHAGNVLVTTEPLRARFIDFTPPNSMWSVEADRALFVERTIEQSRFNLQPERVAREAARIEAEAQAAAVRELETSFRSQLPTPLRDVARATNALGNIAEDTGNTALADLLAKVDEAIRLRLREPRNWRLQQISELRVELQGLDAPTQLRRLIPDTASPELIAARDRLLRGIEDLSRVLAQEP